MYVIKKCNKYMSFENNRYYAFIHEDVKKALMFETLELAQNIVKSCGFIDCDYVKI
jgi:hypothetical protein